MARFERGKGTSLMVVPKATPEEDVNEGLKERRMRYAMPLQAVDNVQLAGVVASSRLLDLLADEDTYRSLNPQAKLKAIELSLTQAFGRADSALQEEKIKRPESDTKRAGMREHLMRLGKLVELPEMRKVEDK